MQLLASGHFFSLITKIISKFVFVEHSKMQNFRYHTHISVKKLFFSHLTIRISLGLIQLKFTLCRQTNITQIKN